MQLFFWRQTVTDQAKRSHPEGGRLHFSHRMFLTVILVRPVLQSPLVSETSAGYLISISICSAICSTLTAACPVFMS